MYGKLAGMTGTADTEAYEFHQIYGLETVVIPPHRPMVRKDMQDKVYRTAREKHQAVIADIRDCHQRGQPVLVGTTSIENNEQLSALLVKEKLPHQVLNAKQHAREAEIVVQAGRRGMITIATNMAGRGTDIVLGGNIEHELDAIRHDEALAQEEKDRRIAARKAEWQEAHDEILALGGLHIIGTERHESRRVDNQLRGRAGRQGDPGSSRFYLSLEDPLLRIFASDRVAAIMDRLKMPDGEAIEHPWVTRAIENAQRKVEARNFDIRKQLLEYDDVANDQRRVIYQQRNEILEAESIADTLAAMREGLIAEFVDQYLPPGSVEEQWDVAGLEALLRGEWNLELPLAQWLAADPALTPEALKHRIADAAHARYREKCANVDESAWHQFEHSVLLQSLDNHWREHLAAMDHLRQGIHLRGYAQKNPKQEYKREAFEMFAAMLDAIKREVTRLTMTVVIRDAADVEAMEEQLAEPANVQYHHADYEEAIGEEHAAPKASSPVERASAKVGRNDPCPCGSGKKYKHCHGKLA
jgi:preprotein translocase subunit SecA